VIVFKKVGVIGAGTMGRGVAVDLILHGIHAVLVDIDTGCLEEAESEILKTVRFAPMLNRQLTRVEPSEVKARLQLSTKMNGVADCDFVVENVRENWQVKKPVYRELDAICGPEICFGVNTSCLSITRIAGLTGRPEKVVGIHFMNPVFMKPVVEVMRGNDTSQETLDRCDVFLKQLEKEAIVVKDSPGFVSNRISHLFMNEAMWVVQDGVATPQQVDDIFKKCFGHKMGPLETADLIGLDVVRDSLQVLYESYQDSKFRSCPLLQRKVDNGELGMKSRRGFFNYPDA